MQDDRARVRRRVHLAHRPCLRNGVRTLVYGITRAAFAHAGRVGGNPALLPARVAFGRVRFLADMSMLAMGGALKRKEKISGRLGDVLSMLYLVSATLKRYEDQGRIREDLPLVRWAVRDALYRAQQAIDGILSNFPVKALATLLRWTIFPLGASFRPPLDSRNHECATIALEPGAARDRLTAGMYVPKTEWRTRASGTPQARGRVPRHRLRADRREAAQGGEERKDRAAGRPRPRLLAREQSILTAEEHAQWSRKEALRKQVIKVDDFPQDFARAEIVESLADHRQDESRLTCTPSPFTSSTARARRSSNRRTAPARSPRPTSPRRPGARCSRASLRARRARRSHPRLRAPSVDEVNIGRVAALRMGCGRKSRLDRDAQLRLGMQALDSGISNILAGRSSVVLGGVDALSRAPLLYGDKMVLWFSDMARPGHPAENCFVRKTSREALLAPVIGIMKGLTDPMVGLLMGQTAENVAHRFGITRAEMDAFSVHSHESVIRRRTTARLAPAAAKRSTTPATSTRSTTACGATPRCRTSRSSSPSSTASSATSRPATARRSPTARRG